MPAFVAHSGVLNKRSAHRRKRTCISASSETQHNALADVSRLGIGTWSWGNKVLFGYSPSQDASLQKAFNTAVVRGITLFDTADSYGTFALNARAELLLGRFLRECPVSTHGVRIASKVASYPWRLTRRSISDACARSAERLGRPVDVAQVHWSTSRYAPWQERSLWDGLADARERGDCVDIGVSNFGPRQFGRVCDYLLQERGVKVASVQAQLSLLSRAPLTSGLVEMTRERGATFIGYSPLCLGLLAGGGERGRGAVRDALFGRVLKGARPLQVELGRVAGERGRRRRRLRLRGVCRRMWL